MKKKIILDCYTSRPEVYKHSKIDKSVNFIPDWWKKLPASQCPVTGEMIARLTMKSCAGFNDFFKYSYTLPLWSELKLLADEETWTYQFADRRSTINMHHPSQHEGFMQDCQHFKLECPWRLVCNKPINWAFVAPTWHDMKGLHLLSGIVNYYYQHNSNIQVLADRPTEVILPLHTPLAHLIPLTEEKVEVRYHLISEEEFDDLDSPGLTFTKWYYKMKRLINKEE